MAEESRALTRSPAIGVNSRRRPRDLLVVGYAATSSDALARLRHSWLGNQLLNKAPSDVVHLWRQGSWAALDRQFAHRVRRVVDLAAELEEELSPARLVESLEVFQRLPNETRLILSDAVHESYRRTYPAAAVAETVVSVARSLGDAIDELRVAWGAERSGEGEVALVRVWNDVQQRAAELLRLLECLPRGVVLP